MNFRIVAPLLALLASAVANPAIAQEISGKYAIILQTTCQTIMSGRAVLEPGSLSNSVGLADFTPDPKDHNKGVAHIDETVIGGPPAASKTGSLAASPRNSTVSYSNTATTLTINAIRYNAIYTEIQNGVAQRVFFNGIAAEGRSPNACAASGVLRAVTG
ncbi:MAG TPA: hypothetical protein VFQ82_03325 [Stellaceae bacterium]|jgi:hypothetical protein|nr:hypothetical protein [Stellaceae bacterium]